MALGSFAVGTSDMLSEEVEGKNSLIVSFCCDYALHLYRLYVGLPLDERRS